MIGQDGTGDIISFPTNTIDVGVIDDTPIVKFSNPPLTAIRQPIAPMAARAAELLIGANGGEQAVDTINLIPFELIVRGSTARPAALSSVGD